ncbi:hypothetical protein Emag_000102 [Eimeria magna]
MPQRQQKGSSSSNSSSSNSSRRGGCLPCEEEPANGLQSGESIEHERRHFS